MMPFVTEELWQRLPRRPGQSSPSIMVAPYPTAEWCGCRDLQAEADMEALLGVVREARALAVSKGLNPGQASDMSIICKVRSRII
jgi:valyl-tRNA synthetase